MITNFQGFLSFLFFSPPEPDLEADKFPKHLVSFSWAAFILLFK